MVWRFVGIFIGIIEVDKSKWYPSIYTKPLTQLHEYAKRLS